MQWLAVAVGGAIGACCRYAISIGIPPTPGKFPVAAFMANTIGSFLMGLLFVAIVEKNFFPSYMEPLLMVGFLGALTTYSTFYIDAMHLILGGHWKMAIVYTLCSVISCISLTCFAYIIAKAYSH